jgi:ATP-dependent Lon protease
VPRQIIEHGLSDSDIAIPEGTLTAIGEQYTMEAGVRNLERQVAAVCRYAAVKLVEAGQVSSDKSPEPHNQMVIKEESLIDILGAPMFEVGDDPKSRVVSPGIAIGLAANAMGGSVLFVEATKMAGSGKVKLTGSLGDVIQESAYIALGWIRSHARELGITADLDSSTNFMNGIDLHIHFPEVRDASLAVLIHGVWGCVRVCGCGCCRCRTDCVGLAGGVCVP